MAIAFGVKRSFEDKDFSKWNESKRIFREKHGIKYTSREGLFVIFGYPTIKFHKGISRSFASVN